MQSDIAISVKNLTKVYHLYDKPIDRLKEALNPFKKTYHHDFYAMNDVSFEVKKGETVGIIGKNGAGKSTLLKMITGVLTPTSGSVEVKGKIASLLELGAGFNPEMTGMENVYLNGTIMGFSKEEMDQKVDAILEFADIGEFIDQPVKMYSSGMFARLAFSVAINSEPDILIVDEVLSVGDKSFQKKCLNRINELQKNGVTILLVSHDEYTIKNNCQKALYLKTGIPLFFGESKRCVDIYLYDLQKNEQSKKLELLEKKEDLADFHFSIIDVNLYNEQNEKTASISSGENIKLQFLYTYTGTYKDKISFVVNLYRHDDLYICGTTTLMEGISPYMPTREGNVEISFPKIKLLAGVYKFRVAINDDTGMGVLCEVVPVCELTIEDDFEAVGIVNLDRKWKVIK